MSAARRVASAIAQAAATVARSMSFDCGNGLHAPICSGCGCDCHG